MSHNEPPKELGALVSRTVAAGAAATSVGEFASPRDWSAPIAVVLEAERSRWFLWLPVWLGAGIGLYFWLPFEPTLTGVAGLLAAASCFRVIVRNGLAAGFFTTVLLTAVVGFTLAKARTEWTRAPVLERQLNRADVRGVVELVEPRPTKGERVTLRVTSLDDLPPEKRPKRVRIRMLQVTPGLKPGDHVHIRAKLGPPSPPSLPGDYDFARAAWFQRLGATGFAMGKVEIETAAPDVAGGMVSRTIETVRQAIGHRVTAALPGETGAIALALITGERGGISDASVAAFRDSGLLHILSISGLHMVVMAGAAFLAVRLMLSAVPRLALYYPTKKWAATAALMAGFGYLLISGSSVATLRSAIMIGIMFMAVLIDRPAIAMRNVAIAALILLVAMPETLLDCGFQMSFAAVICLVAVYELVRNRVGLSIEENHGPARRVAAFFGGIVLSTLIASVSVAPFSIYHFHQTQQYAVAANLMAIPICNVVVMPAALLSLVAMPFGLEGWPLFLMGRGIDVMMWAAATVAAVPGAVGRVAAVPEVSIVLFAFGVLWLCLWRTRLRLLGLAPVALALALAPLQNRAGVIAGRDGALVVARGSDSLFQATPGRHGGFELERWLGTDGDSRQASDAALGDVWRCDASSCVATVNGMKVAVVRHPAALDEDCRLADVVIMPFQKPDGCEKPHLVIDKTAFEESGTHAIYFAEVATAKSSASGPVAAASRLRIDTVAQHRGTRPWTIALGPKPKFIASKPAMPPVGVVGDGRAKQGDAPLSATKDPSSEFDGEE